MENTYGEIITIQKREERRKEKEGKKQMLEQEPETQEELQSMSCSLSKMGYLFDFYVEYHIQGDWMIILDVFNGFQKGTNTNCQNV